MMNELTADQWQALKYVLDEALELPQGEQEAFLQEKLGEDAVLLHHGRSFLAADKGIYDALEDPFRFTWGGDGDQGEESDLVGSQIGDYRLLERIGSGGMGVVYRASRMIEDAEQIVAFKILKRGTDTEEVVRRFRHERRILAGLNQPHIAKLLDGGSTEDQLPYLVMEYVDGAPLFDYFQTAGLGLRQRLELFQKICMAVHFAHQNLVVHRDLKPSNIMVTHSGEPKLLDFGIAKWLSPGSKQQQMTREGWQVMTPEYASPEQFLDEPITTASDIYVLGILFYEIVAGVRHVSSATQGWFGLKNAVCKDGWTKPSARLAQAISQGLEKQPVLGESLADLARAQVWRRVRQLRGDLDNIARMAMHRDPACRYDSAMQFSSDIDRYLKGRVIQARPETLRYLLSKLVVRHKVAVGFLSVMLFLILAFSGFATFQHQRLVEQRDQARSERLRKEDLNRFLSNIFTAADPFARGIEEITAKDLLDNAARDLLQNDQLDPKTKAEFLETIGAINERLGELPNAERLLLAALELKKRHYSPKYKAFYTIHQVLGRYYFNTGEYQKADSHLHLALDGLTRLGDSDGSSRIDVRGTLGELARVLGNYDHAIEHHLRALDLLRQLQPDNGKGIAEQLRPLGVVYYRKGEYDKAVTILQDALKALGEGDVWPIQRSEIMAELGTVYRQWERYDQAEAIFKQIIALRSRVFGPRSLWVSYSYNQLGWLYLRIGQNTKAEEMFIKVLEIRQNLLAPDHTDIAVAQNNLAGAYLQTGRFEKAARFYEEALAIRAKQLGVCHTKYAETLSNLGQVSLSVGELDSAEAFLYEALTTRRRILDDSHSEITRVLYHLGDLRIAQLRFPEAKRILEKVHASFEAKFGPNTSVVGCTLMKLAEVHLHMENNDLAEWYLGESLKALFASVGDQHPYTAEAYLLVGDYVQKHQGPEASGWWFQDAFRILVVRNGPTHPKTRLAQARLNQVRRLLGDGHRFWKPSRGLD